MTISDRPYHHGDLRNGLIQAGLALLAEGGPAAINLREVARRAGVSHAAPYRHFVDKEALIAAIAEDGFQQLGQTIGSAAGAGSVSERFMDLGRAYVAFALANPAVFRLMFSAAVGDRSVHPTLYAASKVGFLLLLEVIAQGQEQEVFAPGATDEVAQSVWAMMHGLAILLVEHQIGPGLHGKPDGDEALATLIEGHLARVLVSVQVR